MSTLLELAEYVGGHVVGDARTEISGVQPFEDAGPDHLTLAAQHRYWSRLDETRAAAVIVPLDCEHREKPLLRVGNPKAAFARLLGFFNRRAFTAAGISRLAHVGKRCSISEKVTIHPFVFVGDGVVIEDNTELFPGVHVGNGCRIGSHCVLYPNVTLYRNISLGHGVIIHGGAVLGADGFGYVFDGRDQVKIPQTGRVVVGDDVEIGANSCVDRATFGTTVLERGVKLDNHVHIGHNCRIGENTVIVGQVGVSGSVQIGRNCVLAGHSGVSDHIRIGDGVTVMAKSEVTKDIPSGRVVSGQPAMDHRRSMKVEAATRRLPELYRQLRKVIGRVKGDG